MSRLFRTWFGRAEKGTHRPIKSRRTRLTVESLEDRVVPTILFEPHLAGESLVPGTTLDALKSSAVYLLYEGAYWNSTQGKQDQATLTADVRKLLSSPYFSGLSQYTASPQGGVQAAFGGSYVDTTALPANYFRGTSWTTLNQRLQNAFNAPNPTILPPSQAPATPIYVFVPDPKVSPGVSWTGYNAEPAGRHQVWVSTSIPTGSSGIGLDPVTETISHEVAESISNSVQVDVPAEVDWSSQISDGEPEDSSPTGVDYSVRLNGVLVQAYWSQKDSAFIVPDGSVRTTFLKPVWNGMTFTGQSNVVNTFYRLTGGGQLQSMVNNAWTTLDSGVLTFDVLPDGTLFDLRATGVLVAQLPGSTTWIRKDTGVHSIALGGDGSLYELKANGRLGRYRNGSWDSAALDSNVKSIAVNSTGALFDLQTNGQLRKYQNGSWGSGAIDTGVRTIVVGGDDALFDLETNGQLWRYQNGSWDSTSLDTSVKALAVGGDGWVYDLETGGQLWRYSNGSWDSGPFDKLISSIAEGSDGSLYELTTTDHLWQYQSGSWSKIDSGVKSIGVGGDGALYDLETNGQVWRYSNNSWGGGAFDSGIKSIDVGGDGSLYELTKTGYLWQYQFGSWSQIDSGVKMVAVDSSGALYDLETNGQLWKYQFSTWGAKPVSTGVTSISVSVFGVLQVQY
jgi:hypothetical protein